MANIHLSYLIKLNPEVCKKLILVIKIYAKLDPPIAPTNQPEVNCLHPFAFKKSMVVLLPSFFSENVT